MTSAVLQQLADLVFSSHVTATISTVSKGVRCGHGSCSQDAGRGWRVHTTHTSFTGGLEEREEREMKQLSKISQLIPQFERLQEQTANSLLETSLQEQLRGLLRTLKRTGLASEVKQSRIKVKMNRNLKQIYNARDELLVIGKNNVEREIGSSEKASSRSSTGRSKAAAKNANDINSINAALSALPPDTPPVRQQVEKLLYNSNTLSDALQTLTRQLASAKLQLSSVTQNSVGSTTAAAGGMVAPVTIGGNATFGASSTAMKPLYLPEFPAIRSNQTRIPTLDEMLSDSGRGDDGTGSSSSSSGSPLNEIEGDSSGSSSGSASALATMGVQHSISSDPSCDCLETQAACGAHQGTDWTWCPVSARCEKTVLQDDPLIGTDHKLYAKDASNNQLKHDLKGEPALAVDAQGHQLGWNYCVPKNLRAFAANVNDDINVAAEADLLSARKAVLNGSGNGSMSGNGSGIGTDSATDVDQSGSTPFPDKVVVMAAPTVHSGCRCRANHEIWDKYDPAKHPRYRLKNPNTGVPAGKFEEVQKEDIYAAREFQGAYLLDLKKIPFRDRFAVQVMAEMFHPDSLEHSTLQESEHAGLCQQLPETSNYAVCPVDPSCKYTATSRWFTGPAGKSWDFCQPRREDQETLWSTFLEG